MCNPGRDGNSVALFSWCWPTHPLSRARYKFRAIKMGETKKKTYRCVAKYRLKLEHEHYTLQILNYHLFFYITDLFSHILTYSHLRPVPSHLHYGRSLFIFCFHPNDLTAKVNMVLHWLLCLFHFSKSHFKGFQINVSTSIA